MRRKRFIASLWMAGLGFASSCAAGESSSAFGIDITLMSGVAAASGPAGSGVCVSQSLSEQNGARVRVVCDSGEFVSISAIPGARFVGTHGGAYTTYFGSSYRGANIAGHGEFANVAGTFASFRVFGVTESEGRLDLLVSF